VSAFIITRIHVGDYDAWRPMFDQDLPRFSDKHGPNVLVEAPANTSTTTAD
jgi:hypothetical protein